MRIEPDSLIWSSLSSLPRPGGRADIRRLSFLEARILDHLRDRALFLPERRAVASYLVLATRGEARLLLCRARQVTWELLQAQDAAERQSAPFDGVELEYYARLGQRLGIGTFSARAAALRLNGYPLQLRRRIRDCLFGESRPMSGPPGERRRMAAAYRAIQEDRSALGELTRHGREGPHGTGREEPE